MAARNKIEIILSAISTGFDGSLRAAASSVKALGAAAQQTERGGLSVARRGIESISVSLDRMKQVAVAAFSASAIHNYASSFIATADSMRNMDQRLLLVSKNTNDYAAAQKTVVDVARDSYQGLGEVTTLYSRMALATDNLNVSQQQLADVTRTVALATALSGATASESSAGLQQFAQAMASNRLGGDELRSVLENMPMLTKVFVDAAGGSISKLREMAEAGELTTEWMMNALIKAKASIEQQAAAMPQTVERAMTGLKNETSKYIDSVNQSTGFTTRLAGAVDFLGQHLDAVAKGGLLALSTGLSVFVGRGISAAVVGVGNLITTLGTMSIAASASATAVSSASSYMTGYATATTATAATSARLLPALFSLVNPITAITTVLGLGVTAWMLWGRSADDELAKAKGRVAELQRTNQMMKELSDPSLKLQATSKNILTAKTEVAKLEKDLEAAISDPVSVPFDDSIGRIAEQLDQAQQKLNIYEQEHAETQKNITISTELRGVKEIAVEMSVTDAIKKQDEERRKVTSSKLENDLAEIAKKRDAELAALGNRYTEEDKMRIKAAINARFDAEAAKAKEDAAEKAAKKGEAAGRREEAEAKRREREQLKAAKLQGKVDTETLRAESERIQLAMEGEKLDAERLGSELERATALLEINRRIAAERIAQKEREAQIISDDPSKTQADLLRAQSEITSQRIEALKTEYADQARVAKASLDDIEQSWRRGIGSVDAYRLAVQAALSTGVLSADEANERLIASGADMGAALSLGFQHARERMQTDAEMMIYIGENVGEQVADGLVSAWDSFITSTKSAKDALIDFARSTISWISQIILKQILMNALGSAGSNGQSGSGIIGAIAGAAASMYSGGGLVQALADGGTVRGWSPSPTADNIPAWLTAREFVHPVDAVDWYGLPFMESIRRKLFPRNLARALAGHTLPRIPSGSRLSGGGMPAAAPATTVQTGDTKLRVINVLDKNMVGDYLRTADGETAIINMIRRNGSAIRTLLR